MKNKRGKLSVEGAKSTKDEVKILRMQAERRKIEHDKYERETKFVRVKVLNGYKLVPIAKAEKLGLKDDPRAQYRHLPPKVEQGELFTTK
jgi:hypothetical protein